MKPSLQLNISQQLTLTPQLQQAIRLLQLSTIDLQQEIQQLLESNPMLEANPQEPEDKEELAVQNHLDESSDFQWSELYQLGKRSTATHQDYNFDNLHCATTNLKDHLRWQLNLASMNDVDRLIATALIDAVQEDGFLSLNPADIQNSLNCEAHPLELEEIEAVRHRLQRFDPVGCFCINLAETLWVQLEQLDEKTLHLNLTKQIVKEDLDLLGQQQFKPLIKKYTTDEKTIQKVLHLIQNLNPKPGHLIHQEITEYLIPDLTVKKINNQWQVLLNQSVLPQLSINTHYASMISRAENSEDNQYLKSNLQEARWFLKSIQSRQETLLRVGTAIMTYQSAFLEHGEEAMKPLILNDIAKALDMHESTISRVTTQKFIHTPRGVFELKYFFSSHVNTHEGECSSIAIRALIKKMIQAENRKKPLSDNKISLLLAEQGIQVARRTVAKYREALNIAPSHERKNIRF